VFLTFQAAVIAKKPAKELWNEGRKNSASYRYGASFIHKQGGLHTVLYVL
jgi:hypothetical protein